MPKKGKTVTYQPNDLVFAKVKGYPCWPACVSGPKDERGTRYEVFFYGTYETAVVKKEEMWPFTPETKNRFGKSKAKGFAEALDEIENRPESGMLQPLPVNEAASNSEPPPPESDQQEELDKTDNQLEESEDSEESVESGILEQSVEEEPPRDPTPPPAKTKRRRSEIAKSNEVEESPVSSAPPAKRRRAENPKPEVEEPEPSKSSAPPPGPPPAKQQKAKKNEEDRKHDEAMRWVMVEQKVFELDIAVRMALHYQEPDMTRCITLLDELQPLAIQPLMLKKYPDIVATLRKMRKYVGPVLDDEAAKQEQENEIQQIRIKANEILENKIQPLFEPLPENTAFGAHFRSLVEEFRNKVGRNIDKEQLAQIMVDPTIG